MPDFLTAFEPARVLALRQIVLTFAMSFVLCFALATVYRWTFRGLSYSRAFVQTMVLGGMIVSMMIMAIGNNLARGLGILGTLAIIRFRTPIRDSRDMMFLFASLGVGIGCGAGTFNVAIIGTFTVSAAMLLLNWSPFASRREYEGLLRFHMKASSEQDRDVEAAMQQCCSSFHMIGMRESMQGEMLEYSYQIRLIDPSYQAELITLLHKIDDVEDPTLVMQRTTVEL